MLPVIPITLSKPRWVLALMAVVGGAVIVKSALQEMNAIRGQLARTESVPLRTRSVTDGPVNTKRLSEATVTVPGGPLRTVTDPRSVLITIVLMGPANVVD